MIVWRTFSENMLSWIFSEHFAFKYWDYFVVQTKNFHSVILYVLFVPSATARISMFCFSYHFRPNFYVHFVKQITWNNVVEIYVTVVCLSYLLRITKVLVSKLGPETTYALWGFLCFSIATLGELRWANVWCGVHLHILWIPFRCASFWQCIYAGMLISL